MRVYGVKKLLAAIVVPELELFLYHGNYFYPRGHCIETPISVGGNRILGVYILVLQQQ